MPSSYGVNCFYARSFGFTSHLPHRRYLQAGQEWVSADGLWKTGHSWPVPPDRLHADQSRTRARLLLLLLPTATTRVHPWDQFQQDLLHHAGRKQR